MDDAELVRQAMAGRATAYEQLVRRWAARVLAVCHARVGRADAAEDLAQETLVRGWRALATLEDAARFGPWLCGIATRACLDWLKSPKRGETTMSALDHDGRPFDAAHPHDGDAATDAERRDEIRSLLHEVERLPEAYRQVLMLFYYDDLSYRDIAAALDVSAATVNARLTKARAMLRSRLTRSAQAKAYSEHSGRAAGATTESAAIATAENARGL
jgi:RNA polymerase sigma-70 factor (ECF subfamily)